MPDPAPLLALLRCLVLLLPLLVWGGAAGHRLFRLRDGYVLLPAALLLGVVSGLALLNALSYLLKPAGALPVTLAALVLGAALLWRRAPSPGPVEWGLRRGETAGYVLAVGGTLALFAAAALNTSWIDTPWQFAAAASIAGGNFPVMDPFSPAHYIQYHYGINLLIAAAMLGLDVPVWRADDPVLILLAATLLTTGYAVVRRWTGSGAAALLGTAMLFWAAGLRAFEIFSMSGLAEVIATARAGALADAWGQLLALAMQDNHAIISGMGGPHAIVTFHRPTALALPLALGAVLLYLLHLERPRAATAALSGLALGTLALAREDLFVMTGAGLGVTWLLHQRKASTAAVPLAPAAEGDASSSLLAEPANGRAGLPHVRRSALLTFAPFVIAAVLAFAQGGVLTDMAFHGDPARTKGSITGFALRWPPGFPSWWRKLVVVGAPGWEREVFKEFGLLLPLYPAALWLLARRRVAWLPALGALTAIGLLAPVFVQYLDHDLELTRVFQMPLMALLLGAALGLTAASARSWRRGALAVSAIAVALAASGSALLWYALFLQYPLADEVRWEEDAPLDRQAGAWAAANLPLGASVLGLSPAYSLRSAPYAGDGVRSPREVGASSPRYPKEGDAAQRALLMADLAGMKALGAGYLWVDSERLLPEGRAALEQAVAGGRLALLHEERGDLCLPPAAPLPSAEGATQTFRLTAGRSLGQSFTAAAGGLCQVEVLLSGRARPDNPPVDLTLESGGGLLPGAPERQARLPGVLIVDDTWYPFPFAPVADSRGRLFTLTLTSPSRRVTNAVATWQRSNFDAAQNLAAGRTPLRTAVEVRTEDGAPALGQLYIRPGYVQTVRKQLYRVVE